MFDIESSEDDSPSETTKRRAPAKAVKKPVKAPLLKGSVKQVVSRPKPPAPAKKEEDTVAVSRTARKQSTTTTSTKKTLSTTVVTNAAKVRTTQTEPTVQRRPASPEKRKAVTETKQTAKVARTTTSRLPDVPESRPAPPAPVPRAAPSKDENQPKAEPRTRQQSVEPARTRVTRSMSAQPEAPPMPERARSRQPSVEPTAQLKRATKKVSADAKTASKTNSNPRPNTKPPAAKPPAPECTTVPSANRKLTNPIVSIPSRRKEPIKAPAKASKKPVIEIDSDGDIDLQTPPPVERKRKPAEEANAMFEMSMLDDSFTMQTPVARTRLIDRLIPYDSPQGRTISKELSGLTMDTDSDSEADEDDEGDDTILPMEDVQTYSQQSNGQNSQFEILGSDPATKVYRSRGGPRITYTKQRSYLTEDANQMEMDLLLMSTPPVAGRLRQLAAKQVESDDDEESGIAALPMKSIHELREAGENKRYIDEVEGYFEDIEEGQSAGQKRSGYVELASKMMTKAFAEKFMSNDFGQRLLDACRPSDIISSFAVEAILWSMMEVDKMSQTIQQMYRVGIPAQLINLLSIEQDVTTVAKERKNNLSKAAQGLVGDLRSKILESAIFKENKPKVVSHKVLGLLVLDTLIQKLRRAGVTNDILARESLQKICKILQSSLTKLASDPENITQQLLFKSSISILESFSSSRDCMLNSPFTPDDLTLLASGLTALPSLAHDDRNLILRLLINLSVGQYSACETLSDPTLLKELLSLLTNNFQIVFGKAEGTEKAPALDTLVLVIGLLTNFTEQSDSTRHKIARDDSTLSNLVTLFLNQCDRTLLAESLEETTTNVAFGYFCILLGNLCRSPDIKQDMARKMPNKTNLLLKQSIEDFIAVNQRMELIIAGEDGEGEAVESSAIAKFKEVAALLG